MPVKFISGLSQDGGGMGVLSRLAWLPVPLFIIVLILSYFLWPGVRFEPRYLLPSLNVIFTTLVPLLVALQAARAFVASRSSAVLMLGCGVLAFAAGSLVAALAVLVWNAPNLAVTSYNTAACLAGVCHLGSAVAAVRPRAAVVGSRWGSWTLLTVAYLAVIAVVLMFSLGAAMELMPPFFLPDREGTPLRQSVLITAILTFSVAAVLFRAVHGSSTTHFVHWYSLALGLIAVGLAGVMPISSLCNLMAWAGRSAQYLGFVYMFIALMAIRGSDKPWEIPLERALRESEERLRVATAAARMGMWFVDIPAARWEFSPLSAHFYGLSDTTPITHERIVALTHPDDRERLAEQSARALATAGAHEFEYRIVRPDGGIRWVLLRGLTELDAAARPWRNMGVMLDITDRKMAEDALRELNQTLEQRVAERTAEVCEQADQLRALATQLSQTEQRERKRLAKILHDHIQQIVVAAIMQAEQIRRDSDSERMRRTAGGVHDMLQEALQASRSLTVELSPPIIHEAGLIGGLNWLAARLAERHQFRLKLQVDDRAEPGLEEMRFLIFECVRELLLNVIKHAGVKEAEVTLMRVDTGEIKLLVRDQGQGFDPDVVRKRRSDDVSFGLFGIQERLVHLKGRMDIESAPGRGTTVTLRMPMVEGERPACTTVNETVLPSDSGTTMQLRRKPDRHRLLIVDDHKIMREGLAEMFRFQSDIEVVGEAADGRQALELAARLVPNVVVMDVNLGEGMDGVEATRGILAINPEIKVVGLSMHIDEDIAHAMLAAGAAAYLTKGGPMEDLLAAIRDCRPENSLGDDDFGG